jgi:hypothetical protein
LKNYFLLFLLFLPQLNRRRRPRPYDWQESCYKNGLKLGLFLSLKTVADSNAITICVGTKYRLKMNTAS